MASLASVLSATPADTKVALKETPDELAFHAEIEAWEEAQREAKGITPLFLTAAEGLKQRILRDGSKRLKGLLKIRE